MYKEIVELFLHSKSKKRVKQRFFQSLLVKKDKIVFTNFHGNGFGDNPKYIALELLRQNKPYDLVWLGDREDKDIPASVRQVTCGSLREMYELATAHVIVSNVKGGLPYYKKENQFYIQTWHGSHSLKEIEAQVEDTLPPGYVEESKADSRDIDVFLSDGSCADDWIRKTFWYSGKVLTCGLPRNDLFFYATRDDVKRIREKLCLPEDVRCLMYAPTFRDDRSYNPYDLDVEAVLDAAAERFGGTWWMLVRLHPNDANRSDLFQYDAHIRNVSFYSDMQELLLISDMLITDYSTCFHEMASYLERPVFFYASDVDRYASKSRRLTSLYYEMPFEKYRSNADLIHGIQSFDREKYNEEVREYKKMEPDCSDGSASKAVVDLIDRVMDGTLSADKSQESLRNP